jgi:hypothetical protein
MIKGFLDFRISSSNLAGFKNLRGLIQKSKEIHHF